MLVRNIVLRDILIKLLTFSIIFNLLFNCMISRYYRLTQADMIRHAMHIGRVCMLKHEFFGRQQNKLPPANRLSVSDKIRLSRAVFLWSNIDYATVHSESSKPVILYILSIDNRGLAVSFDTVGVPVKKIDVSFFAFRKQTQTCMNRSFSQQNREQSFKLDVCFFF